MFSSFPAISNPFSIPRIFGAFSSKPLAIKLESVEIHDIETNPDKRARTLKHLLKLNHANYAILLHNLEFHNHNPHILGSAYLLGAEANHLEAIHESESKSLESWPDSPGEISADDWRDYLGNRHYQRAFLDFFEDQLPLLGYDWKRLVEQYLFEGERPLFHNLVSGLGHPLIHLGYGYEMQSREVAVEAMGLAATCYDFLHKYLDDPSYSQPPTSTQPPTDPPLNGQAPAPLNSTFALLQQVRQDSRFDDAQKASDLEQLFATHEAAILEYWNAWQLSDPTTQFAESQFTPAALLVGSVNFKIGRHYDFFLVHLLTTSHAIRIILPLIPAQNHIPLVRQWWLICIAVYIRQGRPQVDLSRIDKFELQPGQDWKYIDQRATTSKWALDAHYVKALRAMKVAAETWKDEESQKFYLKAAVRMADEFNDWSGWTEAELP